MHVTLECPGLRDLAAISASYAQLTGLLAGFAFSAIVIILSPTRSETSGMNRRAADSGILLPLLAAFIALIIATLSYSLLGGDSASEARGRAATVEIITGVPFGLAVIMLFHGIAMLLHADHINQVAARTAHATAVVITPTMTLYYIIAGASDLDAARAANLMQPCVRGESPLLGEILCGVLAVTLAIALIPRLQPQRWRQWARKAQNAVPIAILVVSVAAAIVGRAISTRSPDLAMSPIVLNIYIAGTFTLLGLLGLMLALGKPEGKHAPDRPETVDGHGAHN